MNTAFVPWAAPFLDAPILPRRPELVLRGDSNAAPTLAAIADEGADRRGEVFEVPLRLPRGCRRREVAALAESVEPLERPVEDRRRLVEELAPSASGSPSRRTIVVRIEIDEPARERTRGVGEARKLVRQDQEPRRQSSRPRLAVLAVDRDRVLARDREQPLDGDRGCRRGAEACVGDRPPAASRSAAAARSSGVRLASVGAGGVVHPQQPRQDTRDRALAGPLRPDQQVHLLLRRSRSRGRTRTTRRASASTRSSSGQSSSRNRSQRIGRRRAPGRRRTGERAAQKNAGVCGWSVLVSEVEDAVRERDDLARVDRRRARRRRARRAAGRVSAMCPIARSASRTFAILYLFGSKGTSSGSPLLVPLSSTAPSRASARAQSERARRRPRASGRRRSGRSRRGDGGAEEHRRSRRSAPRRTASRPPWGHSARAL